MDLQVSEQIAGSVQHITIAGALTNQTAPQAWSVLNAACSNAAIHEIILDAANLQNLDSAGAALLIEAVRQARESGKKLRVEHLSSTLRGLLELVGPDTMLREHDLSRHKSLNVLEKLGAGAATFGHDLVTFFSFVGSFSVELANSLFHPGHIRWHEVLFYMERSGVDAIPIISLINLLLGLILGFQAAIQLRQFGANIYVTHLVGVSITRELGPLLAAIIVAGRSGSAFCAEIGAMQVSEEVAAMDVMGMDRMRFLVMPKIIALVFMLPCLTLLADIVGVFGGLLVGVFQLDISVIPYLLETQRAIVIGDIITGLIKSAVFALLIAGIGCFRGFQVTSDAESVGRQTTSAVVSGIFLIIATDAAFTLTFYALGI